MNETVQTTTRTWSRAMANPDNRFAEAEDIDQLMLLVVGAGSACWHPDGVFDDQSADIVARDGAARAKELGSGR